MITLALFAALVIPLDDPTYRPPEPDMPPRVWIAAEPAEPERPQPIPEAGPVEQWRPLVEAHDAWPVDIMLDIMWCESRGIPTAENPHSTATGLFQIMKSIWWPHGDRSELHDPWLNVELAHHVWTVQGLRAWECWN